MIKCLLKIKKDERGTALLVALLVMGVLLAVSLALSSLIFREVRSTKELMDAGRAYYAAESAVEEALYYIDTKLPGWEPDDEQRIGEVGDMAVFEYEVKNKCNAYPCLDPEEYDHDTMFAYQFYDILELNESITIPLFTVEEGQVVSVKDFTVEFFTNFDPKKHLKFDNKSDISGWDVLRWKVFGMLDTSDGYVTESVHDFTAVSAGKNNADPDEGGGYTFVTNAEEPSWFGTGDCDLFSGDRLTDKIECVPYADPVSSASSIGERQIQICDNLQARDFYLYDSAGEFQSKIACYPIKDFMDRHTGAESTGLNYLSLTNMMNPAMLDDEFYQTNEDKMRASRIYFRVETYGDDTVREFADITASGYSGGVKQSINVKIKKDSYMPVFNFSLYSTYKSEEDEPFYVDNEPKPR